MESVPFSYFRFCVKRKKRSTKMPGCSAQARRAPSLLTRHSSPLCTRRSLFVGLWVFFTTAPVSGHSLSSEEGLRFPYWRPQPSFRTSGGLPAGFGKALGPTVHPQNAALASSPSRKHPRPRGPWSHSAKLAFTPGLVGLVTDAL